jgi:hypothetical protein
MHIFTACRQTYPAGLYLSLTCEVGKVGTLEFPLLAATGCIREVGIVSDDLFEIQANRTVSFSPSLFFLVAQAGLYRQRFKSEQEQTPNG